MRQHLASLDTSTAYLATHPHASFELTPLGPTFPSFSPISYASFIHSLPSPPSPPPSYSPPAPPLYDYGAQETSERGSSPESILSLETPAGSPEHVNLEGTTYGTYGGAEGYGRRVKEEEVDDKGFQSIDYAGQGYEQAASAYPLTYSPYHLYPAPPHPPQPHPSLAVVPTPVGLTAYQSQAHLLALQQQQDAYRHAAQAQSYAFALHAQQLAHHQALQGGPYAPPAQVGQVAAAGAGQAGMTMQAPLSFETAQGTYYFVSHGSSPAIPANHVQAAAKVGSTRSSSVHSIDARLESMEEEEASSDEEEEEVKKVKKGGRKEKKVVAKRFVCEKPGCGVAFARRFNLKSHENAHAGIRDFNCPKCPKMFSRRHDRARHCAAVHGLREDET